MNEPWYLTPSDFLGNLGESDRDQFFLLGDSRNYVKDAFVFRAGDPGRNMYVLRQGRAKIFKVSLSGKEVILWFCFPGEVFGLAEASRGGSRDVYAQVCTDAVIHRIPRQDFSTFIEERPRVAMQVIDLLSCRLRVLGDMLTNLATDDATSRVIKLLLRMCSRYGRINNGCGLLGESPDGGICLDIPLTHQEMSDMLGTSRQTVSTIMSELKKRGVLQTGHRHMHVEPGQLEHILLETTDA
ncbi:MAG: Crp/Fnr family transcriptional regulator [Thiohalocapsa sp.]